MPRSSRTNTRCEEPTSCSLRHPPLLNKEGSISRLNGGEKRAIVRRCGQHAQISLVYKGQDYACLDNQLFWWQLQHASNGISSMYKQRSGSDQLCAVMHAYTHMAYAVLPQEAGTRCMGGGVHDSSMPRQLCDCWGCPETKRLIPYTAASPWQTYSLCAQLLWRQSLPSYCLRSLWTHEPPLSERRSCE